MHLRRKYADCRPQDLHYVYGANCFQHAVGFPLPILARASGRKREVIHYVRLAPGSIHHEPEPEFTTPFDFQKRVVRQCTEEGMVPTQSNQLVRIGFRTLALFIGEPYGAFDFHFAFMNGQGKWETKTQFNQSQQFNSVHLAGLNMYQLHSYWLLPAGHIPLAVRE